VAWKVLKKLDEQNLNLFVECDGRMSYASDRSGLKPLLRGVTEFPEAFAKACVADRVVGLAASYLLVHGQVEEIEAKLITDEACAFLDKFGIHYKFQKKIELLLDERRRAECPMDIMARTSGGVTLFVDELKRQLIS
jgi:hypothetical protein